MSQQRYTPEFKDEAVRQVTEKGHPVQEVAARLGVSSHSLSQVGEGRESRQGRAAPEPELLELPRDRGHRNARLESDLPSGLSAPAELLHAP